MGIIEGKVREVGKHIILIIEVFNLYECSINGQSLKILTIQFLKLSIVIKGSRL